MLSRFFESKAFTFLTKCVDAIIICFYFLLCCIPIFTIGASITAFYYTIHKVVFQGRGYTTEFFRSFKDNFKQSTLSWLIFMGLGAVFGVDLYVTWQLRQQGDKFGNMMFIFIILLMLLIIWAMYTLTFIARFENTFKQTLKLSAGLAVIHFAYSLIILIVLGLFCLFAYAFPAFALFTPLLYCISVHPFFEKIYRQYMTEDDLAEENERLGIDTPIE